MACDYDELEINPFYMALQTNFVDLYERAQECCYFLCIPQTGSLDPQTISQDFAVNHILRPSPYFKGQFMTTHSSNSRTLRLSDDGQHFTTLTGFPEELTVKVLSEELAYNKDYKQYKILILERPFDPKFELQGSQQEKQSGKQLHTPKIVITECTDFLLSFPEIKKPMDKLDRDLEYFCRHYMVLPDYLDDAVIRLRDISFEAQKEMLRKLKPPLDSDIKLQEVLAGATESYLMQAVYHKVFVVIRQRFTHKDQILLSKCHKLNRVRPEEIGIRKEFACPLPLAVVEMANLGSLYTPREKLACLKSTVDNITEGITNFLNDRKQPPSLPGLGTYDGDHEDEAIITSDDLIPILVLVIAQAKCHHLHSDLFYMENFILSSVDKDRDDLSYCLVSVKAAVQYMMETDFSHIQESQNFHDKEISLEELMAATTLQDKHTTRQSDSPGSVVAQKRLDRQLNRITNILERTAQELGQQNLEQMEAGQIRTIFPERVTKLPPPDLIPEQATKDKKNSQLGDFLSALQNDDFDQPFGKQN